MAGWGGVAALYELCSTLYTHPLHTLITQRGHCRDRRGCRQRHLPSEGLARQTLGPQVPGAPGLVCHHLLWGAKLPEKQRKLYWAGGRSEVGRWGSGHLAGFGRDEGSGMVGQRVKTWATLAVLWILNDDRHKLCRSSFRIQRAANTSSGGLRLDPLSRHAYLIAGIRSQAGMRACRVGVHQPHVWSAVRWWGSPPNVTLARSSSSCGVVADS